MIKEKQKRKAKVLLGMLIAVIMTTSIIGFMSGFRGTRYRYKDFKFIFENDMYWIKINNQKIGFHFSPDNVEKIPAEGLENIKSTRMVYISFNTTPNQHLDLARLDLQEKLDLIGIYSIQGSAAANNTFLPQIDCNNATQYVPVIMFTLGNETKIFKTDQNCIIAQARTGIDFLRLKDRIIYETYGIIKNE